MTTSSSGCGHALQWRSYSVSRSKKEPLLRFIVEALEMRGCDVVHTSNPANAPFYIVFEMPGGERRGVLAYAFLANSKATLNRPPDEHRFQVKYGRDLKDVLCVSIDPSHLVTTIFLGIDVEREMFVAADPTMNTPAPMSRSIEFKAENVARTLDEGWTAWERERRPGKSRTRPTAQLGEDVRTEILIGARKERLLDLITLERVARGLDPGERHLVADKMKQMPKGETLPHDLLEELDIEPTALFDLIQGASRLKMAVRGWVAETHLVGFLQKIDGVSRCDRISREGKPDVSLSWKDGPPILIECKNTLRLKFADGTPKLDFQRTRAAKSDPCSRYYARGEFPILAACLHAVTEAWEFRFALTSDLPEHKSCKGRITSGLRVSEPIFTVDPSALFDKCSLS